MKPFALYCSSFLLTLTLVVLYPSSAFASTYGQDAYGTGMYQYGLPIPPPGQFSPPDQADSLAGSDTSEQPQPPTDTPQEPSGSTLEDGAQNDPNQSGSEDTPENEDDINNDPYDQQNSGSDGQPGPFSSGPLPSTRTLAIGAAVAASLLAAILLVKTLNNRSRH